MQRSTEFIGTWYTIRENIEISWKGYKGAVVCPDTDLKDYYAKKHKSLCENVRPSEKTIKRSWRDYNSKIQDFSFVNKSKWSIATIDMRVIKKFLKSPERLKISDLHVRSQVKEPETSLKMLYQILLCYYLIFLAWWSRNENTNNLDGSIGRASVWQSEGSWFKSRSSKMNFSFNISRPSCRKD